MDVEITAKKNGNYTGSCSGCTYTVTRADTAQNLSKAKVLIRKKDDGSFKKVTKINYTGSKTFNFRIVKGTMHWVK